MEESQYDRPVSFFSGRDGVRLAYRELDESRPLGWRAVTTMSTPLVLDALEQAIWARGRAGVTDLAGLVHYTDAGSSAPIAMKDHPVDVPTARTDPSEGIPAE